VALRELQDEVPRMSDEAPAGLEQPLLQTRQRPALDGEGQGQPAKQVAEVVGDDPEQQADLVGSEAVAGEARPVVTALSLLDSPLRRPAPVVEGDDGPIGPGLGGHWLDGSMVNAGASYYPRGASVCGEPYARV